MGIVNYLMEGTYLKMKRRPREMEGLDAENLPIDRKLMMMKHDLQE